jgi:hypothetical protein
MTAINEAAVPLRPAGGAWSSVRDMLQYVSLELANGKTPNGAAYISKGPLLERRAPQVFIGQDVSCGMGITIVPGAIGFEFVVGSGPKRTLTIRDAQHEYVFKEQ